MELVDVVALVASLASLAISAYLVLATRQLAARAQERPRRSERIARKRPKRYISFLVFAEGPTNAQELEEALKETFKRLYGEVALARANLRLVYFDPARLHGIVGTTAEYRDEVLATISMVRRAGRSRVAIIPVGSSGTLKASKRALDQRRGNP
ncbi:MAG: Rpp14/Pop5 family protein [Desulfurococcaceae archaeon]